MKVVVPDASVRPSVQHHMPQQQHNYNPGHETEKGNAYWKYRTPTHAAEYSFRYFLGFYHYLLVSLCPLRDHLWLNIWSFS